MTLSSDNGRANRVAQSLREILGLAHEEIAKSVGVSPATVTAWIAGRRRPRRTSAEALERTLKGLSGHLARGGERPRAVAALLHAQYGSPDLNNKRDPLDELFFILLSLKTSHRTYEETYAHFRSAYHPWSKLLLATAEEVEGTIRSGGLGSIKARAFVDIARRLWEDFGEVTLEPLQTLSDSEVEAYLTSLPGVGIKTARCVAMYALGRDVVPVDTHTYRVGVRIGIIPTSRSPRAAHAAFDQVVPEGLAYALHTNFVAHGREACRDPAPGCGACPINDLCDFSRSRQRVTMPSPSGRGESRNDSARDQLTAVDIYAGCGGLSAGLRAAGFRVAYALDWDKHACATHRHNFPDTVTDCVDIRHVSGQRIREIAGGHIDLLAGGPNCQGLSQRGLRNPDDPRNMMLKEYVRLVSELRPRMFLFENVPGFAHRHNYGLLQDVFGLFEELGYRCAADVLLAANYGAPQLRHRFVMLGALHDLELSFPLPSHHAGETPGLFSRPYVTVGEAIGDLPPIAPDCQDDRPVRLEPIDNPTQFQRWVRDTDVTYNHLCSATAEINLARARHIPEGGNWKDIPPELLPERLFMCRMTDHSTTYARLRRDQPSFTITALFGNITAGAFTHPTQTRALSIREGARLQGFKDSFRFVGPRNSQYRQIGNAVPPLLANAIAEHVAKLLVGDSAFGVKPRINTALFADSRGWDALPVLTPRFKPLFGTATRWPRGWGEEPNNRRERLDNNYSLREEYWPAELKKRRLKPAAAAAG